jgi:signal transduction histidine kinase/CheY-like chemotaxis protein
MAPADEPEHVLVLAPVGRDASLAAQVLAEAGIQARLCRDVAELCQGIEQGAGAAVVAQEALQRPADLQRLLELGARQPSWSDLPILLLVDPESAARDDRRLLGSLNVTILERPLRKGVLGAGTAAALRSRRKQYDARRAIRDRDQFLAMLGHELRNPLMAILFANELIGAADDEATLRVQQQVVERQGRRLARLVDDLLDVSRVTGGKVQLQLAPLDLHEVVLRSAESVAHMAVAAGVAVAVHGTAGACRVEGDPVRLEQVFTNLLANGVKFTPAGGRVDARVAAEGPEAVVRVADTGVGLRPEAIPRIFELFAQVHSSLDRARGGLGLGLTLARSLVALHGGSIGARSDGPGRGSEFTVRLPLAAAGPPVVPVEATAGPAGVAARPAPCRVVLVEDNDDIRANFRLLLERCGHSVVEARDGLDGLQRILDADPDAAFVDLGLPGLDGYEVARRVRSRRPRRPLLVAVSGYGQPEDRARSQRAGFDAHLTKPVDTRELHRLLAQPLREPPPAAS